ncbi:restriction endonuclease subunit S [Salmonella enterica]|nr:restriction endonuclease subunit S [Salmonella enterica subsp. enterica serovar Johannesburg]EJB0210424.1 restriction endonuclease subunit S [Salmonella enterica]EJI5742810.1 restriction endonuclease subunit S [Escherichia coli]
MSEMSYLEKLLDGAEVEWLPLGQIAKKIYSGGTPDTKKNEYWENGDIPWMSSGEVNLKIVYETEKFITETGLKNSSAKFVPKNSIVMALAGQGKTRGKVARTRIDLTTNQSLAAITLDEKTGCSDYIFHFLETQYEALRQLSSGNSGRGGLNLQMISAYKVPIPCPNNPEKSLAIQSEIVRILDKFTALTAELTAELTERKKQYNYYRDQLLSFEDGEVEWKSLGEVAIITIGEFVRKDKQNPDADYPVYNGGRTPTGYYEDFNNDGDKIIVSARGANAGFVNKSSTPYWAGNSCYSISVRSTEQLHWMYVYYYLKQSETKLTGIQQKGGIPAVSKKQMEDLLLPIPSKSEQVRIVTILDKFDTLTSSITEGLPREIELRQKQYEYYRDLLFSFPRPETASN